MIMRITQWCAALTVALSLSGCYVTQKVIPGFLPKSPQDQFAQKVAYLEAHDVNVVALGDTLRFVLHTDDFFDNTDSGEFYCCREPVLTTIASILNQRGCDPVYISGHSDNIGSDETTEKRANDWAFAVSSYLWNNGVARERLHIEGHSDHHEIATNTTVAGSSYNRRVEIFVGPTQQHMG